jgi:hypothetical protein
MKSLCGSKGKLKGKWSEKGKWRGKRQGAGKEKGVTRKKWTRYSIKLLLKVDSDICAPCCTIYTDKIYSPSLK